MSDKKPKSLGALNPTTFLCRNCQMRPAVRTGSLPDYCEVCETSGLMSDGAFVPFSLREVKKERPKRSTFLIMLITAVVWIYFLRACYP
jgi:hypothetical protein